MWIGGIPRVAGWLLASEEGFGSVQLVTVASDSRVTGVVSLSVTVCCDTRAVKGKVPTVTTS